MTERPPDPPAVPADPRSRRRRWRGWIAGIVLGMLAVVIAVLLALQHPRVATGLVNGALARLPALARSGMKVEQVRGTWITGLEITGFRIARGETLLVAVDTIRVRYRPSSLLAGRLDARSLELAGLVVTADLVDTTVRAPRAKRRAPLTVADLLRGRFYRGPAFEIDQLAIRRGRYGGRFGTPDSSAIATDVELRAHGIRLGRDFAFAIDTLGARRTAGGAALDLALAASMERGRLQTRVLRFQSAASAVDAELLLGLDAADSLSEARIVLRPGRLDLSDLGVLFPGLGLAGTIAGEIDLRGPRRDRVSGLVDLTAERARWGGLELESFHLQAKVIEGAADARLTARWEGARIDASGPMRPFDGSPSYHLAVRADRLPARMPGAPWWPGLAARAGAGVTLQVKGSGYARPVAEIDGRIAGEIGAIGFDGGLDATRGLAWNIRRLELDRVDVARLVGDNVASEVSGSIAFSGVSGPAAAQRMDATLALGPSRYGDWRIEEARARLGSRGTTFGGSVRVLAKAGAVDLDSMSGRWDAPGLVRLHGARVHDLDPAALTGSDALAGRINATVHGEVRGLSRNGGPAAAIRSGGASGQLALTLAPSRFRGQSIDRGTVDVRLRGGAFAIDGSLAAPSGSLALEGTMRPLDATPVIELRTVRFTRLDLGAWTGNPSLRSRLDGSLTARGRMPRGTAPSWQGRLDIDPSRMAGMDLSGGIVSGSWSDRRAQLAAELRSGRDTVLARLDVQPAGRETRGQAEVSLPMHVLAALAGRETLTARGRVIANATFHGTTPATMTADGRLRGTGAIGRAALDSLDAGFQLRNGVLAIDTLIARSNVARLTGSGRIALFDSTAVSDLRAQLAVLDVAPLGDLVGADTLAADTTRVDLHVRGNGRERTFELRGSLRSLAWNDARLLASDGRVTGSLDAGWRPRRIRGDATLRRLRGLGVSVAEAKGHVDVESGTTTFDVTGTQDATHRLHLTGAYRADSARRHLALDRFDLVADSASWQLVRPARIDLSPARIEVSRFELRTRTGRIDAHGVIDRRGSQDFRLDLENVGLDMLATWFGRERLSGRLNGGLRLEGPARGPRGSGHVAADLHDGDHPAGTVRSTLTWNGERLDFGGRFATPDGDSLSWNGSLPLAVSLAEADSGSSRVRVLEGDVDVRLLARAFPLDALGPFLDPRAVGELEGTLDLDARLRGSSRAVTGSGRIDVTGGVIPLPGIGVTYRDLRLHGAFANDRLVVNGVHAASGKGSLDARGDIRFVGVTRIEPRIHVDAAKFVFADTPDLRAVGSGSIDITGTLGNPIVRGKATIENSNFFIVQSGLQDPAGAVRLTAADLRMLEENFGEVRATPPGLMLRFYDAADLDLAITLERNNWVRQRVRPKMAVALTGDFRLRKAPHQEPELFGRIAPIPGRGYVEQFARSFDITGGEVLLNGGMKTHRVDIQAEYKPPSDVEGDDDETVIHLDVEGTIEKLKLTLSSEPAMSEVEIVNYIATGKSRTDPGSADASTSLAKDIGLSMVSGFAEEAAQEAIGLDVLQVRFDALQGATLVAGRYLDPQLYVGFRQPLQSGKDTGTSNSDVTYRTSVEVEYAIHQWLVLNLQGETSKLRSFIRARHAY